MIQRLRNRKKGLWKTRLGQLSLFAFGIALGAAPLPAQWYKSYVAGDGFAQYIIPAHDGGYIVAGRNDWDNSAGGNDGVLTVAHIGEDGALIWAKRYSGCCHAAGLQPASNGGYIVLGYPSTDSYPQFFSTILMKVSSNGSVLWARSIWGNGLARLKNGVYVVPAWSEITLIDESGLIRKKLRLKFEQKESYITAIQADEEDGFYVTGRYGSFNIFAAKFSPDGELIWSTRVGGNWYVRASSVSSTGDGGCLVGGWLSDESQGGAWLVKFRAEGNVEWQKADFPGSVDEGWASVALAPHGGYYAAGDSVVETDPLGNIRWAIDFSSANALLADPAGRLLVAGSRRNFDVMEIGPGGAICDSVSKRTLSEFDTSLPSSPAGITVTQIEWKDVAEELVVKPSEIRESTWCAAARFSMTLTAGAGGTTLPAPGTHSFGAGTSASIRAVPDAEYEFAHWTISPGPLVSVQNPVSITMDKAYGLEASFQRIIYAPEDIQGHRYRSSWLGYYDVLIWNSFAANVDIVAYRIYEVQAGGEILVGEAKARNGVNMFARRGVEAVAEISYAIRAVNKEGREGRPGEISISLPAQPLRRTRRP